MMNDKVNTVMTLRQLIEELSLIPEEHKDKPISRIKLREKNVEEKAVGLIYPFCGLEWRHYFDEDCAFIDLSFFGEDAG